MNVEKMGSLSVCSSVVAVKSATVILCRPDCNVVNVKNVLCLSSTASIGQAVHQLLLIQAFRPDRMLAMAHIFVSKVLGDTFMAIIEQPLDLGNIVESEVTEHRNRIYHCSHFISMVQKSGHP